MAVIVDATTPHSFLLALRDVWGFISSQASYGSLLKTPFCLKEFRLYDGNRVPCLDGDGGWMEENVRLQDLPFIATEGFGVEVVDEGSEFMIPNSVQRRISVGMVIGSHGPSMDRIMEIWRVVDDVLRLGCSHLFTFDRSESGGAIQLASYLWDSLEASTLTVQGNRSVTHWLLRFRVLLNLRHLVTLQ